MCNLLPCSLVFFLLFSNNWSKTGQLSSLPAHLPAEPKGCGCSLTSCQLLDIKSLCIFSTRLPRQGKPLHPPTHTQADLHVLSFKLQQNFMSHLSLYHCSSFCFCSSFHFLFLSSGATYPVCINVIYLNIHSIQSSQTVTILSYSGQMHASYIAPLPTPKKRIMCTDGLLCLF